MLEIPPRLLLAEVKERFEEEFYLKMYPDVAAAIAAGERTSGWDHFESYGFSEGRLGFPFDAEWYLSSYPLAAAEIRSGAAGSAQEHFFRFGEARGYLPHNSARRPENAALMKQRFGGMWIDAPNSHDLIEGRLEIGSITKLEAQSLHHFREHGYAILESAIPEALLRRGRLALEKAYEGAYTGLLFECHAVSREATPWRHEINDFPAKALDIHMFSPVLRDVMFSERVKRFLTLLFECNPMASQTLGFLRGSAQEAHQDSAYVAYSIPRQFAASWIALEDVEANAGELFYYSGSHKLEDYVYAENFKSVSEAARSGANREEVGLQVQEHVDGLGRRSEELECRKRTFMARAGDVLIWHADLAHGGLPVSRNVTRKSLVTHYCPRYLAPLFMERQSLDLFAHNSGACFTSGAYAGMSPIG